MKIRPSAILRLIAWVMVACVSMPFILPKAFALAPSSQTEKVRDAVEQVEQNPLLEKNLSDATSLETHEPEIPDDWAIDPNSIVYGSGTDPTRTIETRYAAAVVLMNEKGEVLFAKNNEKLGSGWTIPSTFIGREDDPDAFQHLQEKTARSVGVRLRKIKLIGKRMGKREGSQLLMHVYFAEVYEGQPHDTGVLHETGLPKYSEFGFYDPKKFLRGEISGKYTLRGAGDCTRCLGTILHGGSYELFKSVHDKPAAVEGIPAQGISTLRAQLQSASNDQSAFQHMFGESSSQVLSYVTGKGDLAMIEKYSQEHLEHGGSGWERRLRFNPSGEYTRSKHRHEVTISGKTFVFFSTRNRGPAGRHYLEKEAKIIRIAFEKGLAAADAALFEVGKEPIMIQPISEGTSFSSLPLEKGFKNEEVIRAFGIALGRLHALGVVHGDLTYYDVPKEDHIFVFETEHEPRISFIDFEFAETGASQEQMRDEFGLVGKFLENKLSYIRAASSPMLKEAFSKGYLDGLQQRLEVGDHSGNMLERAL